MGGSQEDVQGLVDELFNTDEMQEKLMNHPNQGALKAYVLEMVKKGEFTGFGR